MVIVLEFLPVITMQPAFRALMEKSGLQCNSNSQTILKQSGCLTLPPAMWSVFSDIRTNNMVEGWHFKPIICILDAIIQTSYHVLGILHMEQAHCEAATQHADLCADPPVRRQKYLCLN